MKWNSIVKNEMYMSICVKVIAVMLWYYIHNLHENKIKNVKKVIVSAVKKGVNYYTRKLR